MKTYQEIKRENEKEFNEFEGIFFAFSDKQFKEGLEKIGVKEDASQLIYSLGSGGYILKTRSVDFRDMLDRHAGAIKELRKNEKELIKAIAYELNNHEYNYTGDIEPALDALNLTASEINPGIIKRAVKLSFA